MALINAQTIFSPELKRLGIVPFIYPSAGAAVWEIQ